MRLIDVDKLLEHKFKSASERMDLTVEYMGGWNDAIDSINENAPTIDAEPVVRCKDCEYYNGEDKYCVNDIFAKPDGYCMYGKRKKMNKELAIRILRGEVLGTNEQTDEAIDMAIKALKEQPAIYCKDCNFCGEIDENGWHCCENLGVGMPKNGFCSDAERREDVKVN